MTAALLAGCAIWALTTPAARPIGAATSRRFVVPTFAAVVALGAVAMVRSPVTAVLAALAVGVTWGARRLWAARTRARAAGQARHRVLECCELLASELAAGQPPDAALGEAADEWDVLRPVAVTAAYGGDVPSALRRAAASHGSGDLRLVAAAWQISHRTGLGLADALTRVATSLREVRSTERVVAGELASARATARLMAALPAVCLLIGSGSGGNPVGFLLTTLPGVVCLAAGVSLGLAGLAWIERIAGSVGR